jgi:tRNA pseudouridine55 synthase
MTSFDVIAKLRKILGTQKIGHSGTLDPNAEGLLLILVGNATKLTPFLHGGQKVYQATLKFGLKTSTADVWGETIEERLIQTFSDDQLEKVRQSFIGKSMQTPPMVSALSVNGKRLYEYARENIEIERSQREIFIDMLQIKRIDTGLSLSVSCSSGTYVRVLCEDIAEQLGNIACMTSLIRTQIDAIKLSDAVKFEDIDSQNLTWIDPLMLIHYPKLELDDVLNVYHGKRLELEGCEHRVAITHQHKLLAIYEYDEALKNYKSIRGLW